MKLSKKPREEFDYLTTIKNINKMHGSPKYLSKDNKNQNVNNLVKDPIFNESVPIKVRLIKAAHLNPNINLTKIHHINQNPKVYSKESYNIDDKTNSVNLKKINKNKTSKIPFNSRTKINEKQNINKNKNQNEEEIEIKKLYYDVKDNNNNDVIKYKNLLISSKIVDKDYQKINKLINIKTHKYNSGKSSDVEDKDNYNKNTFNKINLKRMTLLSPKFTYNKPLNSNILGNTYSVFTKNSNFSKDLLYTDSRGFGGMSSDNIFSNYDNTSENNSVSFNKVNTYNSNNKMNETSSNHNITEDKIKVIKNNNKNKCYNLKTYIRKNHQHMLMSDRQNTSPLNVRNYNNNNSFNITNNNYKYIYLSPKKEINPPNSNNDNTEIKLEELILFEERLNDIYIALNTKNIYDGGASNECIEFMVFYFHSSLKNIFPYFFNGMNKVIIKSSINLKLFAIIITYHLSLNPALLNKLIKELKNIFSNENDIVPIINKNCCEIVKNLNIILNFYKSIENNYYLDFIEIFASISKISEIEIHNYFYKHLYKNAVIGEPMPKYNSIKQESHLSFRESYKNINNANSHSRKKTHSKNKEKEPEVIINYQKYKISPPFLKKPNEKKYTLVLDLEETLININQDGTCILRPGLFSFLSSIKPFYELISFTNESKYSSDSIIKQIEAKNKYFDYNLYREHLTFNGKEFIKDITKLGRNIKKIIIVDNIANNFKLTPGNGIQIAPFFSDNSEKDTVLLELKKLLIIIYKSGYEDLRDAIKKYSKEIKKNITKEYKE